MLGSHEHDGADPHQLLQHRLREGLLLQDLAAQPAGPQPGCARAPHDTLQFSGAVQTTAAGSTMCARPQQAPEAGLAAVCVAPTCDSACVLAVRCGQALWVHCSRHAAHVHQLACWQVCVSGLRPPEVAAATPPTFCLPVNGLVTQLGHCKVHQHLRGVLEALQVQEWLQHAVLEEHQVCRHGNGRRGACCCARGGAAL